MKRIQQLVSIALFLWISPSLIHAQSAEKVESVSIAVSDLDRSMQFF